MRQWINLFEAAFAGSDTYWFHPETKVIIPADDHGETVARDPERFGVDWQIADEMESAFPEHLEYDTFSGDETEEELENLPEPGPTPAELEGPNWHGTWYRNDAWEQLAMNRGWVRVGEGGRGHGSYVSAASPDLIWAIAKHLQKSGAVGKTMEVELSSAQHQGFVVLSPEQVAALVKAGPKRAAEFLNKLG